MLRSFPEPLLMAAVVKVSWIGKPAKRIRNCGKPLPEIRGGGEGGREEGREHRKSPSGCKMKEWQRMLGVHQPVSHSSYSGALRHRPTSDRGNTASRFASIHSGKMKLTLLLFVMTGQGGISWIIDCSSLASRLPLLPLIPPNPTCVVVVSPTQCLSIIEGLDCSNE